MPATTPNRGYPYPVGTDPIDVAVDVQRLAEAIDDDVNVQDSRTDAVEVGVSTLQGQMTALTNRVATLEGQVSQLSTAYTNLVADVFHYTNHRKTRGDQVIVTTDALGWVSYTGDSWSMTPPVAMTATMADGNQAGMVVSVIQPRSNGFDAQIEYVAGGNVVNVAVRISYVAYGAG